MVNSENLGKYYSNFVGKESARRSFYDKIQTLDHNFKKISCVLTEQLQQLNKDTYHFLLQFLKPSTRLEHVFCNNLLSAMYRSEIMSQSGGPVSFMFCLSLAKQLLQNEDILNTNEYDLVSSYETATNKVKTIIENIAHPIYKNDFQETLSSTCYGDKLISNVVYEALLLAGLEGKLFVEQGRQENFVIEEKCGHSFPLKPYKYFLDNERSWNRNKVKLLLVDGFVEKVSELDHLLTVAYDTKQPMAIISHGFSEEVVATLKTNQQRKNFDVFPIRITSDLENINTIADLSVVCGTEPVSSFKGDLLVFKKFEDLPTIDKIRATIKEVTFEQSGTGLGINEHIRQLLDKRANNKDFDDVQELLDKRLRSMVSNAVVIHLPEVPVAIQDAYRVKIDNALRASKTLLNYGSINLKDLVNKLEKPLTPMDKLIAEGISFLSKQYTREIPALSLYVAIAISGRSMLGLLASDGAVVVED